MGDVVLKATRFLYSFLFIGMSSGPCGHPVVGTSRTDHVHEPLVVMKSSILD